MRMGSHHALGADPSELAGARLGRGVVKRVWSTFARPYRRMLIGFLTTIVAAALVQLVPPLVFRQVIDDAIPESDRGLVTVLALVAVGAAVVEGALGLAERWWSA